MRTEGGEGRRTEGRRWENGGVMDEEGGKKGRGRRREGERMEGLRGEDGGEKMGEWWGDGR